MATATTLRLSSAARGLGARTWAVLGVSAFLLVYLATYVQVISPLYVESGLANDLPPDGSIVAAVVLAALPALWLPLRASRPSTIGLWMIYMAGYVPSMIIPGFVLGRGWSMLPYWLALSLSFVGVVALVNAVRLRLPDLALSMRTYRWLLIGLALGGTALAVAFFGIPTSIPGLDTVYDVRDEFSDALGRAGRTGGYAVWWTGTAIAPLLIGYGAWTRRPLMIAGGFSLFALVYSLAAFRSIFFTAVVVVGLVILVRRMPRRLGVVAPVSAIVLIGIGVLIAAANWVIPLSLAVRRLLVVPGQVIAYYYDEFANGPHYLLSHSILSWLTDSPYTVPPPVLVGRGYFGQAQNANGNLWADGLANFGVPGLVITSIVLAALLIGLDAAGRGKPAVVAVAIGGLSVWSLTNSGILTAVMTHGIAVTGVLLWLLPRRRQPAMAGAPRVAHLTSVHRSDDPRILLKECASLAEAGFEVVLIGRGDAPTTVPPGVTFVRAGDAGSRASRILTLPARVLVRAWRWGADVYHVHDPELLPAAVILKLRGARVIYDAHEDLPRQIEYKDYLPPVLRRPLALLAAAIEQVAARLIDGVVAATPRIATRFPSDRTIVVQNFPLRSEFGDREPVPYAERDRAVVYVGRLTEVVGARVMAEAAAAVGRPDVRYVLAGPIDPALADEVRELAAPETVELPGWIGRPEVRKLLSGARVGLVLFQPVGNYVEAYPTKLFEYMASGIPAVASDFPLWRSIVAESEAGILVDPTDPDAVADGIRSLLDDPSLAAAMGERGRRAVLERYRWEDQAGRLVELYRRLLHRVPASPNVTPMSGGVARSTR